MGKVIKTGIVLAIGFLMSTNVNANLIICTDEDGNSGSGGKNATSLIDTFLDGGVLGNSNCGPFTGNDSSDLTSTDGGYGFNLYNAITDLDGWVELDKMQELVKDSNVYTSGGIITGDGWGTTSGTFSFTDNSGYTGDYLIALKFDGVYSTYLSSMVATSWVWNTDAEDNGDGTYGDNGFAISHLTVYTKGESDCCTEVPEPASLALMGLGLLGMGAVSRRRRKS